MNEWTSVLEGLPKGHQRVWAVFVYLPDEFAIEKNGHEPFVHVQLTYGDETGDFEHTYYINQENLYVTHWKYADVPEPPRNARELARKLDSQWELSEQWAAKHEVDA